MKQRKIITNKLFSISLPGIFATIAVARSSVYAIPNFYGSRVSESGISITFAIIAIIGLFISGFGSIIVFIMLQVKLSKPLKKIIRKLLL